MSDRQVSRARRVAGSLLAALWFAAAAPAAAQSHPPLLLESAGAAAPVDAAPGVSFTLVFRLTNTATADRTIDIRTTAPPGWQMLFASDRVSLASQAAWLETVAVVPPRTARADEYVLRLDASPAGEPTVSVSQLVRIAPRRELRVSWDEAPPFLAAGAAVTLGLTIANDGNLVEDVVLDVRTLAGSIVKPSWTAGALSPGEARRVPIDVRTPAQPLRAERETITARVATTATAAAAEAGYQFDVVPEGRNADTPRNALPSTMAIRFGSHRDPGFGSFAGSGTLDQARSVRMDFDFAARDRSNPLLLERDEYVVNVAGPRGALSLGDRVWSMSLLTDSGHYGFGGGGHVEADRWFAAGFVDSGRRDVREPSQTGGSIGVRLGPARASAQLLERFENRPGSPSIGRIGTARLALVPTRGFSGDVEVGTGRAASGASSAVGGQAMHTSRFATVYGRRVRADAAYPIRDRTSLIDGLGLSLRPVGQLVLEGTFDGTEQLPPERLPVDAPTRQRTTRAAVAWGSLARVQAGRFDWTTPGGDWAAGWRRESIAAQVTIPMGLVRLTPGAERGTQAGPGFGETPFSRNSLRANVRWKRSSVSARAEYGRGVLGNATREVRRVSLGGTLRPAKGTLFHFLANENSVDTPWLEGSRWTDATLEQTLPWPHRIVATYRRYTGGQSLQPNSEAYRVDYVIPLGIPLRRSSDEGRVTVRLRDPQAAGSQTPVLVQLEKTSLLTDRNGVAEFNRVTPGEHFVTIANAPFGADRTVVPAFPLRVDVAPGRLVVIDAVVVRTSQIGGRVEVFQYESGGLAQASASLSTLVPVRGLAGVVIELTGGGDTRRAVTDEEGRYAFEGIPPGAYRLRIVRVALPAFYQLEASELSLTVSSGDSADRSFRAIPKVQGL